MRFQTRKAKKGPFLVVQEKVVYTRIARRRRKYGELKKRWGISRTRGPTGEGEDKEGLFLRGEKEIAKYGQTVSTTKREKKRGQRSAKPSGDHTL